jgi:hypothetical protein
MPPASTYNIQPAQPDLRGTAVDMIHTTITKKFTKKYQLKSSEAELKII